MAFRYAAPISPFSLEEIVRPFVSVLSAPVNRQPPQVSEAAPEASLTWGRASSFQLPDTATDPVQDPIGDFENPIDDRELLNPEFLRWTPAELEAFLRDNSLTIGDLSRQVGDLGAQITGFEIKFPDYTEGDEKDLILTETGRSVSTVRVENPADPSQYVLVERIDVIDFTSSTGGRLVMRFRND